MNRSAYAPLRLLFEFFSCRQDAHVRFLRGETGFYTLGWISRV